MRFNLAVSTTTLAMFTLMAPNPAAAECWSWQTDCAQAPSAWSSTGPQRSFITDDRRNIIGDLYKPAPGRRTQIRDTRRNILGYIEPSGRVTDTRRQEIGSIGEFYD